MSAGRDLESHLAPVDRRDLLSRASRICVGCFVGQPGRRKCRSAYHLDLRDRANHDAIRGDHVPPLPNLQPRDRISHRRHCFGHRVLHVLRHRRHRGTRSWGGRARRNGREPLRRRLLSVALVRASPEAVFEPGHRSGRSTMTSTLPLSATVCPTSTPGRRCTTASADPSRARCTRPAGVALDRESQRRHRHPRIHSPEPRVRSSRCPS